MEKTHKQLVLGHLQEYGTITSKQAILYFGATRLSHYIYQLRKEGYPITSVNTRVKSRQGRPTTIATYTLAQ
jgi:biotin operon repressor